MHSEKNQKRKKDVPGPDLGSPVPADSCCLPMWLGRDPLGP